jgi:hypothetical protein
MAVIKFISDLRLLGGAVIEKARLENLSTANAPASPALGQLYFDTTLQKVMVWSTVDAVEQWVSVGTDAGDISDLDTRVSAIENAPYASEGFVTGITDDLDGRLDTIENAPYASEGFVTGITDALDGRLDAIEEAPYASEGFVTGLTDALDGRLDTIEGYDLDTRVTAIENAPYASEGFVTGITDDLDGRLDTIENAPYASEGFVTGITDDLDGRLDTLEGYDVDTRITAIESAPYASEGFVIGAVEAHNLDVDAHPMGIKWFTPTQIINGDLSTTVAAQTDVALSTSDTVVASFSAADPLAWLQFSGEITLDGTGSVTLDVEIQDNLSGVVGPIALVVERGVATPFEYMIQAPVTGIAKDYDLVIKTQSGTETADISIVAIDAFGSDPFVVRSELDSAVGDLDGRLDTIEGYDLDTRVSAIENAPYASEGFVTGITDALDGRLDSVEADKVDRLDFTITGDDVETEFTSSAMAGDLYPAVSVWENASGSLVLVDVTRAYSAGPDTTTITVSFNEAPADGATYRVAVKA